jgi:hypothetical protein
VLYKFVDTLIVSMTLADTSNIPRRDTCSFWNEESLFFSTHARAVSHGLRITNPQIAGPVRRSKLIVSTDLLLLNSLGAILGGRVPILRCHCVTLSVCFTIDTRRSQRRRVLHQVSD